MIAAPADARPGLCLLVPGLFWPSQLPSDAVPVVPALEAWLARAEPQTGQPRSFEAAVFSLFGAEAPAEGDLPVAAVTRALDMGVIDNGWWLRADPVHLHPARDRLLLVADSHKLDITQDEANRLVVELMELYKADGWLLKAARPGRWYLKPPRAPKITTAPLPDVLGHDIHPYLPRGADGKAWHTVLNEIQILLHTAKTNEERERRGKPPINSLWFWGGGRLPKLKPVSLAGLWSEEPLSLAFARLSQTPSHARPADFESWRRRAKRTGEHIVVLDELRQPLLYGDAETWSSTLAQLERGWFAPLFAAVREGRAAQAALCTDNGRRFVLTRRLARRWWRWRRPLASYA